MWALAPLIATAAAISAQADLWATSRVFLAGFLPLLVILASFVNPRSYWKLTLFDFLCGLAALLALIIWLVVKLPTITILLVILGEGFATLPTIRKAWSNPETETKLTYITSFVSVLLILPSIPVWNIQNSAFQVYLLISNSILLFVVYKKQLGFRR